VISRSRALAASVIAVALLSLGLASQALAATPAWQPVAYTGPTNLPPLQSEIQTVFVDAEAGTFTLKFGAATTAPITFNATAAEVEAALDALSTIGGAGGSVSVVGGPGGPGAKSPYAVTFGGALANTNVAEMTAESTALSGGTSHNATVATTLGGGPGETTLVLMLQNIGGFESNGVITYKAKLPPDVTTTGTPNGVDTWGAIVGLASWTCSAGAGQTEIACTNIGRVPPGALASSIKVPITAAPDARSGTIEFEVSGGGASPKSDTLPLTISSAPAPPGLQTAVAGAYDANGNSDTRAGAHPYSASTAIFANTKLSQKGKVVVSGEVKDIVADLPPGFLGNPIAVPQCPETTEEINCPIDTMVGVVQPITEVGTSFLPFPVFNTEAPYGSPAKFRFNIIGQVPLNAIGSVRSEEDYGLTVGSYNTPQIAMVYGTFFTLWGTPADSSHDSARCSQRTLTGPPVTCGSSDAPKTAFITSATDCAEQAAEPPNTLVRVSTWQDPSSYSEKIVPIPPVVGCNELKAEANVKFDTAESKSDSTASFQTEVTVPSEGLTNPKKRTTPELKETVLQLPKGVVLNASAAEGLQACSEQQIGLKNQIDPATGLPVLERAPSPLRFSEETNHCPEASKIGTGELKTALLQETLQGTLYLAAQGKGNPFGSLFAIYLVIENPRNGIFIKMPGRVQPDSQTGQMTVSFENLPQLPFTSLKLNLKGGDRSALATPTTCGTYTTTAVTTPWSAPESGPANQSASSFGINQGPNGEACAETPQERPFNVGWKAGAENVTAGASGPFDFQVTRAAGSQEIENLELQTPVGVTASLNGVPYCTENEIKQAESSTGKQEQADPACPAASKVGTLTTGAGSGPSPLYVQGNLYLAGPYKGAPLSVVAITPAVAGPFDLGDVVVRAALSVNSETTQISAKTDPIPQIVDGVVLRIRDVRIHLDRADWTINPTNCNPMSVKLTAHGNSGAVANLSNRFQVGNCSSLPFEPDLKLKVIGKTGRNAKPALRAELTAKPGEANIATAQVNLPHSEFLEQNHIKTVCTRVQFAEGDGNGSACPAGSVYGHATAWSPLLEKPLEGNVYLRSNGGERKLPDLVAALDGQVDIALWGKVDSGPNHGIRNTFEVVPDAPVSRFVLQMNGGRKGLLVNSENLCSPKAQRKAIARFTGQNGKVHAFKPLVQNQCKKKKAKKNKKGHKKSGRK
jgi:hypothetical protein